jgi:transitional endoplasmic reticulum ATPase
MPEQGSGPSGLRPEIVRFEEDGCRVELIDPAGILAAALEGPVEVLHGHPFPAPVRRARLTVTTAGTGTGHRFRIEVEAREPGPTRSAFDPARLGLDPVRLGIAGPVGVLLARGIATKDPVTRIAAGAGLVAFEAYRQLAVRRAAPLGTAEVEAGVAGHVPADPVVPSREYTVESPESAVDDLAEAVRGLLATVREATGPAALRGTTVRVSRYPNGRWAPAGASDQVRLDHVGGLGDIVTQLRETAISFRHPDVMARWGARRPQGILLYGPPGTGKTMLARALANEIGAKFREIRTPEILDKWLGGSERNIKKIFAEARRWREPTVMLFDEFDSIISYAGAGGDAASQAVNSVAGIFKQEMNTLIEDNPNVIVVATTNFPHRVDESLIRSGRFDLKLAVPLPDQAGRAEILTKMIRALIADHEVGGFRMFADDVDPAGVAAVAPGLAGADLKEILRRTQLAKAMVEARGGPVTPIGQQDLLAGVAALRRAGQRAS